MASDGDGGSGTTPAKRYLLKTIEVLESIVPTMRPPESRVYDEADIQRLEKAVNKTKEWLDKNPRAHEKAYYRMERKLDRLSEHIIWDCAKDVLEDVQ